MAFLAQFNVFSLYLKTILSVKNSPSTPSETSKSSYQFKVKGDALQGYKTIKSKK